MEYLILMAVVILLFIGSAFDTTTLALICAAVFLWAVIPYMVFGPWGLLIFAGAVTTAWLHKDN